MQDSLVSCFQWFNTKHSWYRYRPAWQFAYSIRYVCLDEYFLILVHKITTLFEFVYPWTMVHFKRWSLPDLCMFLFLNQITQYFLAIKWQNIKKKLTCRLFEFIKNSLHQIKIAVTFWHSNKILSECDPIFKYFISISIYTKHDILY